jgi:DNA-binding response OmpR family regulator
LGLTITKSLVEMHGGQMWVRSVLGQGSTFGFSLPVAAVPAAELAPHSYLETQIASGKPKIMIVDAELTTAELLRYHLEIEGFQVGLALDNEEVILRVALEQPDMVVLLPGLREPNTSQMNLPLLYRLKQDSRIRQIPVALLSIVQEGRQTFRLRALTYLTRPVSDKELVGEIAELVGNGYGEPEIDEDSDLGRGLALVANDVPSARFYLDQALQEAGYTTLIASNGAQAVTLARRHRPDLVLLDLNILDYEGLELLQTLKGNCSTAEILGLTTVAHQSGESNYALALVLGTIDFPNKVILADELAARIGKCLLSTANP